MEDLTVRQQMVNRPFVREFIKRKHIEFPFQRSSNGVSGLTFLPLDLEFRWVVKWQNQIQGEVEYLCTELFRRSFPHASVPRTELAVDPRFIDPLRDFFGKKESVASIHKPLFMQYLNGSNLAKLSQFERFFKLSGEQLFQLGRNFGEIAGYDFLIANSDRFLPKHFRGKINKYYCVNSGNILVEMDKDVLVRVHFIDNAPLFDEFYTSTEAHVSYSEGTSAAFEGGFSIFGNSDSEEEVSQKPSSPISKEETHERTAYHEDFLYFISAKENDFERMAQQMYIGIINDIDDDKVKKKSTWRPNYEAFVSDLGKKQAFIEGAMRGLSEAQEKLNSAPIYEIALELDAEKDWSLETSRILLDFIKLNMTALIHHKKNRRQMANSIEALFQNVNMALDQLKKTTTPPEIVPTAPSQVTHENPFRPLLDDIRGCLANYDDEKFRRARFNLNKALQQHPDNEDLLRVMERIQEVAAYFRDNGKVLVSPEKNKGGSSSVGTSTVSSGSSTPSKAQRSLFDE